MGPEDKTVNERNPSVPESEPTEDPGWDNEDTPADDDYDNNSGVWSSDD